MFPSSEEGRETPIVLDPLERANLNHWKTHVEAEIILRPTVSRLLCLVIGHPSVADDQILPSDICGFLLVRLLLDLKTSL
jgi:hypothetical protein